MWQRYQGERLNIYKLCLYHK